MSHYYRLDGHEPIHEPNIEAWARWFEKADRRVALAKIGKVTISTVFLGMDHSFGGAVPMLFETLAYGEQGDELELTRYSTWDEAIDGHELLVSYFRDQNQ